MNDNIVLYKNGEIELNISVDNETIWLTQKDIVEIFNKDQSVISRHINNILKDKEVDEKSNMQKMHIANSDKPVKLYSLDIVLAVGYRTNSAKAIEFRKWATKVLKQYITQSYVINSNKITNDRFILLEKDVHSLKGKIDRIIVDNTTPSQGIFYNGQIFDAYAFVNNLIKNAKHKIVLIDNYIDDSILTMLSKNQDVKVTLYTKAISKKLKLDIDKYNAQYNNLNVQTTKKFHDRFLLIDNEAYHIGASLKDLGKKIFAFSKIDISLLKKELEQ